jgi:hypothetical protein
MRDKVQHSLRSINVSGSYNLAKVWDFEVYNFKLVSSANDRYVYERATRSGTIKVIFTSQPGYFDYKVTIEFTSLDNSTTTYKQLIFDRYVSDLRKEIKYERNVEVY